MSEQDTRFSNDADSRRAFDCRRIRNIARQLGVESAIPETDIELHGTIGAVCGIFYRKIAATKQKLEVLEAERRALEKQEPVRYLYRYELLGDTAVYNELRGSEEPLETIPLYSRPLPAPAPDLQKRVDELEAKLTFVEGIAEADGTLITGLRGEIAGLTKKLAEHQALILKYRKDYLTENNNGETDCVTPLDCALYSGTGELATLISAEYQRGIEEGKKIANEEDKKS